MQRRNTHHGEEERSGKSGVVEDAGGENYRVERRDLGGEEGDHCDRHRNVSKPQLDAGSTKPHTAR